MTRKDLTMLYMFSDATKLADIFEKNIEATVNIFVSIHFFPSLTGKAWSRGQKLIEIELPYLQNKNLFE